MTLEKLQPIESLAQGQLIRFMTCGSVDDGKSTLIGRLLLDTQAILSDVLQAISKTSEKKGLDRVDLSLVTDGLEAEREQGITIDVAYRYFSTGNRKYIIADAPGHEQYTRNMVTAASNADIAVIIIDARHGVVKQTRRHSTIAHLFGIPHLIIAINKMDLVDYSQKRFLEICQEYQEFAQQLGIKQLSFIPISALQGDGVVHQSSKMPWYTGPTFLECLNQISVNQHHQSEHSSSFRFPIQCVCRPQASQDPELHDYRSYMGRLLSGNLHVGQSICVLPSGLRSSIKEILQGSQIQSSACDQQSIGVLLTDDIDISRGNMLVPVEKDLQPVICQQIQACICWLHQTPLSAQRVYILRHTTREVRIKITSIDSVLDIETLQKHAQNEIRINDIAYLDLKLAAPIYADSYQHNKHTGAFTLIDPQNHHTIAAGLILKSYS